MPYTLFLLPLGIAIIDWWAVAANRRLEYALKPAVMLALLLVLGWVGNFRGGQIWFALGLIFSLGGDVALMLSPRFFLAGLVSFLLAHLAYIIGLNPSLPPLNAASLLIAILVTLVGGQIYLRVAGGLRARRLSRLKWPVFLYSIAISSMVFSALVSLMRPGWPPLSAYCVSAGALLFLLSDIWLAWDKFVQPARANRALRMAAYHLGQILLIIGALSL